MSKRNDLRRKLFNEQEGLCFYCHGPMILLNKYPSGGILFKNICTIEHICNVYVGDNRRKAPLVAACYECNHTSAKHLETKHKKEHTRKSIEGNEKKLKKLQQLLRNNNISGEVKTELSGLIKSIKRMLKKNDPPVIKNIDRKEN